MSYKYNFMYMSVEEDHDTVGRMREIKFEVCK